MDLGVGLYEMRVAEALEGRRPSLATKIGPAAFSRSTRSGNVPPHASPRTRTSSPRPPRQSAHQDHCRNTKTQARVEKSAEIGRLTPHIVPKPKPIRVDSRLLPATLIGPCLTSVASRN